MAVARRRVFSFVMAVSVTALLAGCEDGLDFDLRGSLGSGLDTTSAALGVTADRPDTDNRGIISYPNYQVAVARRGDTVRDVANRVGIPPEQLADHNSLATHDRLRQGEVLLLPDRVAEPSSQTGGTGQVLPPSNVDISSLAGSAIDNADIQTEELEAAPRPTRPSDVQIGYEPVRHTVTRGETAFSIARLYNVSVRALAEWNGLGNDFTIRERQILLIPPAQPGAPATSPRPKPRTESAVSQPGQGSATPTPPSASQPLPKDTSKQEVKKPAAPKLEQTPTSSAQMSYPVDGRIIRTFKKGKNNGIDISADAGSPVKAAASGTVAAITTDADDVTIIVVRHADNVMTVYYNVADVAVKKGAKVSRNQAIAKVPSEKNFVHFEVRKGFDIVDPMPFLE
ncbi:LysM peptidoglycan-binding domain-containing protein [Cognatishimia sp.]|uniref:LysM peptidoglycan-binding domain-containing protein n=1 Tax=Cognatishimia sp. TaxID=2211648 RepID=UPI0035154DFD